VRLHGGTVEVSNEGHGQGAAFVVTLRAAREPVRPRERREPSRTSASLAGCRIVLVEDHGDSREMLVDAIHDVTRARKIAERSAR
jgi:hypothetical protein